MVEIRKTQQYDEWIATLCDRAARQRIEVRVFRLALGGCLAWGRARAGASFGASQGADEAWDWPPTTTSHEPATPDGAENRPGPAG